MHLLEQPTEIDAGDLTTAKIIGDRLNRSYPGHLWAVNVSWRQGIVNIQNMRLPPKYGYTLHLLPTYSSSSLEARAMRAAGEILERYRLERGAFNEDAYMALPVNRLGDVIGEVK